jgi:formyltetrahydrofolate deformylase
LPIDAVGVVSNHDDLRRSGAELTVLARYMHVPSDDMCRKLDGRCINIHHSFLPGFKGARPRLQAHERGVKVVGATAHSVTSNLDEGPILEQDTVRVGHGLTGDGFVRIGKDVESVVLSGSVHWHAERRVLLNGQRTVVIPQGA